MRGQNLLAWDRGSPGIGSAPQGTAPGAPGDPEYTPSSLWASVSPAENEQPAADELHASAIATCRSFWLFIQRENTERTPLSCLLLNLGAPGQPSKDAKSAPLSQAGLGLSLCSAQTPCAALSKSLSF